MPETSNSENIELDIATLKIEDENENKISSLEKETLPTRINDINYLDLITLEKFCQGRRSQFVKQIFPQFFIGTLVKFKVFNEIDEENFIEFSNNIGDLDNPKDRAHIYTILAEHLFDQLIHKIQKNTTLIMNIIEAFRYDQWYTTMADEWEAHLNDECKQARLLLSTNRDSKNNKMANVKTIKANNLINFPEPIAYCIDRKSKMEQVITQLDLLFKNGKGWLVIYGMRGSGKTVLVESSIRKFTNIPFVDGIFWINIGHINNVNNEEMFNMAIYSKLEILFDSINYFFNTEHPKPEKLEVMELRLKFHFAKQSKALIILDDVQSKNVLKYFQFSVPVLVTTSDKDIIPYELLNVKFISTQCESGNILNIDESLILLKNCLPSNVNYCYLEKSHYLRNIMEKVEGFPFCIPFIANWMEPFMDDCSIYNEEKLKNLEPLWRELSEIITRQNLIDSLLEKSIENMDQQLIDCFYYFSIFADQVSMSMLKTLWDLNPLIIGNYLSQLSKKSLIKIQYKFKNQNNDNMNNNKFYNTNYLIANYLQKKLGKEKCKELHLKLIETYLNKYCLLSTGEPKIYDFSKLPDDDYIYNCLSYHINASKRYDLFPEIFLNLNFLQKAIRLVGQSHILSDYHYYEEYFYAQKLKFNDFRKFMASSTDISNPFVDLIQVALCHSNDSIVYNEALKIINDNSKFYFEWCNKDNFVLENQLLPKEISFQCKKSKYAALSPDSRYIISIEDSHLYFWDVNTEELLSKEKVHDDDINHCVFSFNGQYILTISDDGKAILWKIKMQKTNPRNSNEYFFERRRKNSGNSSCFISYKRFIPNHSKFKFDSSSIYRCALKCGDISPNNSYILLSSINFIYLFSLHDEKQLFSSPIEDDFISEVTSCQFSPDSSYFLLSASIFVYVYMIHMDFKSDESLQVFLTNKLEHEFVVHNAVFGSLSNNYLNIFVSSNKNVLQWKIEKVGFPDKHSKEKAPFRYDLIGNGSVYISICAVSHDGKRIAAFENTGNKICLWNIEESQCYFCFHTTSSIVSLSFSRNISGKEYLFALNCKSEITLWSLKEIDSKMPVMTLKDDLSVAFNQTESMLNVLIIDDKEYLRLFKDISGVEDKDFNEHLKIELIRYNNDVQNINYPKLKITCCDISARGFSIFCTDVGHIFLYNHSNCHLLGCTNLGLPIVQCKFLIEDNAEESNGDIKFIIMSRYEFNLYRYDSEIAEIINYYSESVIGNQLFESFDCVSSKLVILLTRQGKLYCFNNELCQTHNFEINLSDSTITSLHTYNINNNDEYFIIISLASKFLIIYYFINSILIFNHRLKLNQIPRCCRICSKYIVYGCDDGSIGLINYGLSKAAKPSSLVPWIRQHSQSTWILHLTISPDEQFILSAADSIKLWHNDGTLIQTFVTYGNVSKFFVQFHPMVIDNQMSDKVDNEREPKITIVTMTEAKALYILENFRRKRILKNNII